MQFIQQRWKGDTSYWSRFVLTAWCSLESLFSVLGSKSTAKAPLNAVASVTRVIVSTASGAEPWKASGEHGWVVHGESWFFIQEVDQNRSVTADCTGKPHYRHLLLFTCTCSNNFDEGTFSLERDVNVFECLFYRNTRRQVTCSWTNSYTLTLGKCLFHRYQSSNTELRIYLFIYLF